MDDFIRFITEIVDPTVQEFVANPGSVRHASLACVVTFHSIDYLAFDQALQRRPSGKVRGLREAYRGASPDFKTVDDIAHAFKHAVTEPPGNRLKSDDAVKHNGAFSRDFSSDSDRHRVTVQGHPEIDLLDTVKRALAFLRDQFQIGVKCATLRARL